MNLVLVVARPSPGQDVAGSPLAALLASLREEVARVRRVPPGTLASGTLAELAAAIGPDEVTDARVSYADGPAGAERAIERAIAAGLDEVAVLPVAVAAEPGETPFPSPATIDELRERVSAVCARHPDADVILVGSSDADAPRLAEVLGILRSAGSEEPELLDAAVARAFDGDASRFGRFMALLQDAVPDGTRIALRGSVVQGESYRTGEPFDSRGPGTSDLDLVLLGEDAMALWHPEAFYIPAVNTFPLYDAQRWVAPGLDPARSAAQEVAGRPVAIQAMARWFLDLRSGLQGTAYVLLDG